MKKIKKINELSGALDDKIVRILSACHDGEDLYDVLIETYLEDLPGSWEADAEEITFRIIDAVGEYEKSGKAIQESHRPGTAHAETAYLSGWLEDRLPEECTDDEKCRLLGLLLQGCESFDSAAEWRLRDDETAAELPSPVSGEEGYEALKKRLFDSILQDNTSSVMAAQSMEILKKGRYGAPLGDSDVRNLQRCITAMALYIAVMKGEVREMSCTSVTPEIAVIIVCHTADIQETEIRKMWMSGKEYAGRISDIWKNTRRNILLQNCDVLIADIFSPKIGVGIFLQKSLSAWDLFTGEWSPLMELSKHNYQLIIRVANEWDVKGTEEKLRGRIAVILGENAAATTAATSEATTEATSEATTEVTTEATTEVNPAG